MELLKTSSPDFTADKSLRFTVNDSGSKSERLIPDSFILKAFFHKVHSEKTGPDPAKRHSCGER